MIEILLLIILIIIVLSLILYLIIPFLSVRNKQATLKEAKAIVLSCMDFRLVDDIVSKLNKRGYLNNYDNFVLAGASLGYNGIPNTSGWAETFNEHVNIAKTFHDIKEIIIIDHLQCKAYQEVYSEEELQGTLEREKHILNLKLARDTLNREYPTLTVHLFIIDIEGEIMEKIN
jgi:carbonic anhydrase